VSTDLVRIHRDAVLEAVVVDLDAEFQSGWRGGRHASREEYRAQLAHIDLTRERAQTDLQIALLLTIIVIVLATMYILTH
jgi:hypothetical protein